MLRLTLALAALLALPAQASAVEGFAGVTERGSLVRFSSENVFALSKPARMTGLAAGERIVALGKGARGLVGVGTSARLYAIDPVTARATAIGPTFPQGLRGSRFSLAVAPGAERARLLSDVGQDLVVDLTTGVTTEGPGLRAARDGSQLRPAADMAPDGSLVGVQIHPDVLVRELVAGSTTMAQMPLAGPRGVPLGEPLSFQLGENGVGYVVAVATELQRDRQSVLTYIDPSTGGRSGSESHSVQFFGRRINTFAALGSVPADRTPPRVRIRIPKRISVGRLLDRKLPIDVRSNEAAQATASLEVLGRNSGLAFVTRDTPGRLRFNYFAPSAREKRRLRAGIGHHLLVRIHVNDLKGNRRRLLRVVRLIR
jgi:hypothetical protein